MNVLDLSASEIVKNVKAKNISGFEVAEAYAREIESRNTETNSVVCINAQALDLAKQRDANGNVKGALAGLPLGVKDLFCTKGLATTACSKILENFVPPYTATCVQRLEDQGALVLAKLNMDEFAMGSSNETSFFGPCKNPWDLSRVPGGSSGGSAAAVAAGLVPVSLGTDTGGSIRQPAHFCGVTGVKPTYGSISRYGMVAFASSLDQAGPIGKNLADCAALLDVMIAKDVKDGTSLKRRVASMADLEPRSLKGVRFGRPKEYLDCDLHPDVAKSYENLQKTIESLGGEIVDISLPHTSLAVAVYYLVATSEASSNLSRYDGARFGYRSQKDVEGKPITDLETLYTQTRTEGFGDEVRRRILLGTFSLSAGYVGAFYKKAAQVRRLISQDFQSAFQSCDYIVTPVSASPAFKIGEKISDPLEMFKNDILTTPASLAGLPALSLPVGMSKDGLPIGAQLIGTAFCEDAMIAHGMTIESALDFKELPRVR